jgi:hypothetical protein
MTQNMTILHISLNGLQSVDISISIVALVVIVLTGLVLILICNWTGLFLSHDIKLLIKIGDIGEVQIKKNHETAQISHQAWTELVTRKAGLPIDPEHDVIIEVYDSWYQLFKEIRLLVKSIPASKLKDRNTAKLAELLIKTLNIGLRPHLTMWQAKFRRWYGHQIQKDGNEDKSPQTIQQQYEHYDDLMKDLLRINKELIDYVGQIRKLF